MLRSLPIVLSLIFLAAPVLAQTPDDKAVAVIERAVNVLGGQSYLNVRSQIGKGKYSVMRDGAVISFQSFIDTIRFPDFERTEFRGQGSRVVQVNTGMTGWVYDGDKESVKVQTEKQVADFQRGLRTSLDNLLRGYWRGQGAITYIGKRAGTLGKRNDVVRLTYTDGFIVEFEFDADGTPQKSLYKRPNGDGGDTKEEDRYAQFIEVDGIKVPFIVDHFSDGKQLSRINYDSIEFNRPIADSFFAQPANAKEAKKHGN